MSERTKINLNKFSNGSIELTVEKEINPIATIDRLAEYAVVFSKAYSEKIVWIMQYARDLYSVFEAIENYNKLKMLIQNNYMIEELKILILLKLHVEY